jgi:hypothetical protein
MIAAGGSDKGQRRKASFSFQKAPTIAELWYWEEKELRLKLKVGFACLWRSLVVDGADLRNRRWNHVQPLLYLPR